MRIVSAGNATDTTVNGGFLEIESGIAAKTVVSAGSMRVNMSNTVEGVTLLNGKLELNEATANATVVTGGTVLVFSSGGISGTTLNDGFIDLFSGTAAKTVISGGAMRVNMSNSITDTTLNNGELTLSAASANITVMNGGAMQVVSGGTLAGTTVNAGQLTMDSGAAFTDTTVQGGTVSFTGATITNIEIGSGATVTMDSESTLGGLAEFVADAIILIDGTVAFDTSLTTAETAQIKGLSVAAAGENAAYTLTDEAAVKGTYLLATGAAGFNGEVAFGEYTLRVNMPVIVNDSLSYTLSITEGSDLALTIADKPGVPLLVYANSEWTDLAKDTVVDVKVGTAKIGYDAFALLADAIAGVTENGTVEIVGGTISFADGYSKTILVDAEASVVGTATFDAPITINGTVVFDTSIATETAAQFGGFSNVAGDTIYSLTVPEVVTGTWLLASDAASFNSTVTYDKYTLKVGKSVVVDKALTFTLGITGNNELALTIAEYVPGTPVQTYANINWSVRKDGDIVMIPGGDTAEIGYDAFATLDAAIAAVTENGTVEVTGGEVSFTEGYSKTILVDADATVVGTAVFDKPITVNGTFAFDTAVATETTAQFGGFSNVAGTAAYTLTDEAAKIGTYLLASDVTSFDSTVKFDEYRLKVGESVLVNDALVYRLSLTDGTLALSIAERPALTYANGSWADKEDGDVVTIPDGTAVIGYDAFATLDAAIAAVTEDGAIEVTGGTVSFADGYSKTITVDTDAIVVGTAVFDKPITVNGTFAFDTAVATETAAQFGGFSNVAGTAAYTLTDAAAKRGTYLLASGIISFDSTVKFNEYTLKVGEDVLVDDSLVYTLGLARGTLALTITPVRTYANSNWADKKDGDVVTVPGGTAVIGHDAFATLAAAISAVTADGEIEVTGGEVSFAKGYSKTITVDTDATVVGTAVFDKPITVNGTFAFDTAIATETAAQFVGFSNVAGTAAYTLTDAAAKSGTYLLASGVTAFDSTVKFNEYTLKVGEDVLVDNSLIYTLSLTEGTLALTIAAKPPVRTYADSNWAGKKDGDVVTVTGGTAVIGYNAFATLNAAIAAVTADGAVEVTGGTVSFAEGYSKTITVDTDATVVGTAVFDKPITVNGTFAFDTAIATETAAQFVGFSSVAGTAAYTLTDAAANKGTYLLASGVAAFDSTVKFNEYTLKVGEDVLVDDSLIYTLSLTEGTLALTIADKPVPPTPTTFVAKSDIDGNGVSDVMFVWTGEHGEGNYQHGYWMNGTNVWQSANSAHPAEWENLGCYDMNNNGKADSVLVGNVYTETSGKGAYIGYYLDADDKPDGSTWQNIGYLNNEEDIAWQNKVGNLTGNAGMNSIVWYAPELFAVGLWTDGTTEWIPLSSSFGGEFWNLVGCGDFDGDGKDSVLMNYNNGQFFYSVDIDGNTKSLGDLQWTGWQLRAIGDFSGDGKDDIVLFHELTGSMVLCADGNIDNYASIGQLAADDWFVVGAGDYNGDKKDDLLVRQYSTGMLGYYVCADQNQWVELGRGVGMEWTVIA
jgi:phosphotransacetylase